jgi:hypothetical protein
MLGVQATIGAIPGHEWFRQALDDFSLSEEMWRRCGGTGSSVFPVGLGPDNVG